MTRTEKSVSGRRKSRGFSLVELLIALVIGLIMMTGLIQIFLANRQSYRVMEGANFMQENMRFAVDRIAQSVRMADHFGTAKRSNISGAGTGSACTPGWARDLTYGVVGVDGAAALPSMFSGCINPLNYQPLTDIIMVRFAGPDVLAPAAARTATQWYVRSSTTTATAAFLLGSATLPVPTEQDKQVFLMAYNAELYWIRRCSDPGADNLCATGDDGDTPIAIPTLMRSYLDSAGAWVSEPMAEGVEQLQIEYQTMNRQWMNAATVAAQTTLLTSPWDTVTGARIAGLMRSAQRDNGFPADTRTYVLSGDTPSYTPDVAAQKFLRMPYEANAVIRARVRPAPAI